MRGETLEQLVARLNGSAYLPNKEPTAMAKVVKLPKGKEINFSSSGGATGKYPWDEWFKVDEDGHGSLLMLEQDEGDTKKDFDVEVDAMPAKIKTAARRRYKVVQISRRDADGKKLENALIIKARNMTADERAAEDILRAEEKEAARAKREADKVESNGAAE